jgi:ankyrin repeat protein
MTAAQWRRDGMDRALVDASQDGNILDMCRLINQGADVDYVLKFMHEGVEKSETLLTQAAFMGHADAVRVLISRNADVNKSCDGFTVLHTSAEGGHAPVMQLLISKGASWIDVRSKLGQTPQAAFFGTGSSHLPS